MLRKRTPPAIYNSNRIFEKPIPCPIPTIDGQATEEEIGEERVSAIRGFILRLRRGSDRLLRATDNPGDNQSK